MKDDAVDAFVLRMGLCSSSLGADLDMANARMKQDLDRYKERMRAEKIKDDKMKEENVENFDNLKRNLIKDFFGYKQARYEIINRDVINALSRVIVSLDDSIRAIDKYKAEAEKKNEPELVNRDLCFGRGGMYSVEVYKNKDDKYSFKIYTHGSGVLFESKYDFNSKEEAWAAIRGFFAGLEKGKE